MTTSRSEANKALVRRYVEAFNRGDLDALRGLFAPDALIWGVLGWGAVDAVMPIWRDLHEGMVMTLAVEEMIAEGDTVAVRFTERGRFVGPFRGQQPTGRSYELIAMEWFQIKDGLIHRRWGARDGASHARQTGFVNA